MDSVLSCFPDLGSREQFYRSGDRMQVEGALNGVAVNERINSHEGKRGRGHLVSDTQCLGD